MIKSVCKYCGVGCGLEYEPDSLIGDVTYTHRTYIFPLLNEYIAL